MNNKLTPRECEVLNWWAFGYTAAEIAAGFNLGRRTVETHRTNGMEKLGLKRRYQVLEWCMRQG